jgi:hypothetical protein
MRHTIKRQSSELLVHRQRRYRERVGERDGEKVTGLRRGASRQQSARTRIRRHRVHTAVLLGSRELPEAAPASARASEAEALVLHVCGAGGVLQCQQARARSHAGRAARAADTSTLESLSVPDPVEHHLVSDVRHGSRFVLVCEAAEVFLWSENSGPLRGESAGVIPRVFLASLALPRPPPAPWRWMTMNRSRPHLRNPRRQVYRVCARCSCAASGCCS